MTLAIAFFTALCLLAMYETGWFGDECDACCGAYEQPSACVQSCRSEAP